MRTSLFRGIAYKYFSPSTAFYKFFEVLWREQQRVLLISLTRHPPVQWNRQRQRVILHTLSLFCLLLVRFFMSACARNRSLSRCCQQRSALPLCTRFVLLTCLHKHEYSTLPPRQVWSFGIGGRNWRATHTLWLLIKGRNRRHCLDDLVRATQQGPGLVIDGIEALFIHRLLFAPLQEPVKDTQ